MNGPAMIGFGSGTAAMTYGLVAPDVWFYMAGFVALLFAALIEGVET